MRRKTLLGFVGILGIWLTAGLALPFVNVLKSLTPEQLMVARGVLTASLVLILVRGRVFGVDRITFVLGLCFALACLGLYKGIRAWGASPTIVIITATPIVNFIVVWYQGKKVSRAAVLSLCFMMVGVTVALRPWGWGNYFRLEGLIWSLFGAIMNGAFYEALARAKAPRLQRCFWQAIAVAVIGVLGSYRTSWSMVVSDYQLQLMLIGFALVGGFLYFLANIQAFDNLPTEAASVLAQGETPAVILMAGVLLNERLTVIQWLGVGIALYGAWYLSRWLSRQSVQK